MFYRNVPKENEVNYIRLVENEVYLTVRYGWITLNFFFHFHSTAELTSSHQGCSTLRRNVTDNNYETPHHYTEI